MRSFQVAMWKMREYFSRTFGRSSIQCDLSARWRDKCRVDVAATKLNGGWEYQQGRASLSARRKGGALYQ
jgi:hypothetical protein